MGTGAGPWPRPLWSVAAYAGTDLRPWSAVSTAVTGLVKKNSPSGCASSWRLGALRARPFQCLDLALMPLTEKHLEHDST